MTDQGLSLLEPDWLAPDWIGAVSSTRRGGVSLGPWGLPQGAPGGLNLGVHCGDRAAHVLRNRALLARYLPETPVWLNQVHGTRVLDADNAADRAGKIDADAALTRTPGRVLAVQSADCLPILLADTALPIVAVAHAGWRGLCAGVIEACVRAMCARGANPQTLIAWLGPAIGPDAFEVGSEVRAAFVERRVQDEKWFRPAVGTGQWYADLAGLARARLESLAVRAVSDCRRCTLSEPMHFYSYRRDGITGRMASFVWIRPNRS